jgi:PAS domain S-box-containing protein
MVETIKSDGVNSFEPPVRVLILEDSLRDAKLIASTLKDKGYRVYYEVTDSPELFRESLEKAEYDLILADFNLRNWNANDALEILKKSGKDIPLIVVTGSLGDEAAVDCIKRGAADFVLKDRPARLPAAVQRALEEKRLRTENKRAEEAARDTNRRLQVLMGNLPGMAYRCRNTPEWPMEFVSEGCLALTGYTPEEMTNHAGIEYGNLIHPEDQEAVSREVQGAVRSGRPFQLEYRITTKDGRLVHVWEQGRLVAGSDSGEQWLEGFITDATPRKQAEMELHRVNRALRTISHCNEVLVRATEEFHLLEDICGILVREGGYRMAWVGFAENDEGKSVRPAAHAGIEQAYLQSANITWADTERGRGPTGVAIRTGKPVVARNTQTDAHLDPWREEQLKRGYASGIALPIKLDDNNVGALMVYAQEADAFDSAEMQLLMQLSNDLAYGIQTLRTREERKRAEEDLRLARFSVDHASDSVIWSDIQGRIIYANEAACRNLGRSLGELLSLTIPEIDPLFPKEDWGTYWQTLRTLGTLTFETQCISRLGGVLTLEVTANYQEFNGKGYCFAFGRDITGRKRAEQELRLAQFSMEHASDGVFWMDSEGRIVRVNEAACHALERSREELLSLSIPDIDPLFRKETWAKTWEKLRSSGSLEFETQHRTKQGRVFPVAIAASHLEFDGKEYSCAIVRDITEHKQAEEALRESEERFRATFENAGIGMALVDLQGRPFKSNPTVRQMLGYSEEELSRMVFTEFTHPDDRELDWRLYTEMTAGKREKYEVEKRYLKKGGGVVWGLLTASLAKDRDGRPVCAIAMVQDISERKQAGEALRESERKYRQLHESMRDGFARGDKDGRLVEVNDAFCKIVGYTPEELSKLTYQDLTPERWHDAENDIVEKEVLARGYSEVYEKEYRRKDGAIIPVELRTYLMLDESGNPCGMWAVVRDITERKWTERMLQEYEKVVEGTDELIVVVDRDYRHLLANRAFLDKVGLEREDVVGCPVSEVLGREPFERVVKEKMDECFQGKVVRYEAKRQYPKLGERDIFASYFPIEGENGVDRLACVLQDITERKRAEEALRESERKFRRFAETITEVFWTADHLLTKLLYVSPSYERVWGRSCASLYENPGSFLEAIHPQDRERVLANLEARNNSQPFEHEYRIVQPDGVVRWIWDRGFPAHDEPGGSTWWVGVAQDITERKQAEEALIAERHLLHTVMDNLPDLIYFKDREGHFARINLAHAKSFGLSHPSEAVGKTDFDFHTPEHAQEAWADEQEIIRTGQPLVGKEENIVRQDGRVTWVSTTKMPLRDPSGSIIGTFGVSRDITQRKQAEEALKENEEKYRSVVMNIPDVVWTIDSEGRVVFITPNIEKLGGFTAEEVYRAGLGLLIDTSHSDDIQKIQNAIEAVFRDRQPRNIEYRGRRKDGEWIWVEARAVGAFEKNGKWFVQGLLSDITERKRAEEALRQSEEKYRALVTNIPDVVWTVDAELHYVFVSKDVQTASGFSTEEVLEHGSELYLDALHPDDAHKVKEAFHALFTHGRPFDLEYRLKRKDGEWIWLHDRALATYEKNGIRYADGLRADITERKRAEEEILFKTALLEGQSETAIDGILIVDDEDHIVLANKQFGLNFGVPDELLSTKDDLIVRKYVKDQVEDPSAFVARVNYLNSHWKEKGNDELKFKNGKVFDRYSAPLVDSNGRHRGRIWYFRDITDRKREQKAILESEERYRTLFENAPVGIYRTTPDGRILAGNPALIRMLGYSSFEELAKCDLNNIYFAPEYPRSRFMALLEEQGEVAALESAWRKLDGNVLHIRENARAVRDASGKLLYYEGTVEDITERMRTEDEHVRLVTAIEQSAEAVVITNPQGTIEYVNPAFTRITGYTRAEAMGQNPRILKSGNQDEAIYRQLWETILQGKPWHGEIINRRKDGSLYTEQMSVTPVRGARGDVTHFIATKQDITARKQLELQVTQGQKMEAVGRLAGGVAHDFNNLLTIINGYAQLLMERSTPEDPRRSMFDEILTAGERAASLTRQLLAFSRRQVMEPRVLDLNHVLADTEKMLRRLIGEDVDLRTKYEAALGRVKVDPGQIEQVIMNLAVNARDAMPEGGELLIETSNVEVDEDYARSHPNISPGKYVMVAVSDTGCGMDKETQAHVFEPFFTTKERGKGTGLGLATVYGIIKQSGGFIWVYSEPGHGSKFKIYFPSVEEAVPTADPAKARSTKLAKGTETVMVVEDEEGVRSLVCKALISKGYRVLEAEGAAVALQIAEQFKEPIHLLLTDVVMPQTGGKALAMRLIALHPETKVLYMSGYTTDAIVRQGILEEGTSFLQKPFAPSALLQKVREVLNAKPGTQP